MELLTVKDCIPEKDYKDQIVVVKPEFFKEEFRLAKFQLFDARGGFGCDPVAMGRAVYGKFVIDGEAARLDRGDIIGVVKPEIYEVWKKEYTK